MAKYKYIVQESSVTPGDVLIIKLIPQKGGDIFDFKPGQYAMLSFQNSTGKLFADHPFSIASSPTQKEFLKFGIKIMGNFTQNLAKLKLGDTISVSGPYGNFVFKENKYQNVVHIAGGIGITPFISAAKYATDKNLSNDLTMLYSSRTLESATFHNDIQSLEKINPHFKAIFSITNEEFPENTPGIEKGYIDQKMILKYASPLEDKTFLLCGPPRFMEAMEKHLAILGVPKNRVLKEAFSMTPKLPFRENFKNIFSVYGLTAIILIFFLNFIYQTNGVKSSPEKLALNRNESVSSLINKIVAERKINILNLQNETLNKTNSANLNKQLEIQKTIFKQTSLKQQSPQKTPVKSSFFPIKVKPRTTIS